VLSKKNKATLKIDYAIFFKILTGKIYVVKSQLRIFFKLQCFNKKINSFADHQSVKTSAKL